MAEEDRHVQPRRLITMGEDLWGPLGSLVGPTKRSQVIRELVAWYVRKPGAKLPERPPRQD